MNKIAKNYQKQMNRSSETCETISKDPQSVSVTFQQKKSGTEKN